MAYIVMACKFMAYMYVSGPSGTSGGAVPLLHASRMHHDGARVFGSGQCVVLAEQNYSSVTVAPALSTTCIVMTYPVLGLAPVCGIRYCRQTGMRPTAGLTWCVAGSVTHAPSHSNGACVSAQTCLKKSMDSCVCVSVCTLCLYVHCVCMLCLYGCLYMCMHLRSCGMCAFTYSCMLLHSSSNRPTLLTMDSQAPRQENAPTRRPHLC